MTGKIGFSESREGISRGGGRFVAEGVLVAGLLIVDVWQHQLSGYSGIYSTSD